MDSHTALLGKLDELVQDIKNIARKPKESHLSELNAVCERIPGLTTFARDNKKEIEDVCGEILTLAISIEEKGPLHEDYAVLRQAEIKGMQDKIFKILTDETPHKN